MMLLSWVNETCIEDSQAVAVKRWKRAPRILVEVKVSLEPPLGDIDRCNWSEAENKVFF
jgi:hypothetical protein